MLFIIKNTDLRVRGFACFDRLHVEGGIGGYPVQQYRTKNWEIPKFDEIPIPHL